MESTSQMLKNNDNSNVPKILPLTTFIPIDLGGNIFPTVCFLYFARKREFFYLNVICVGSKLGQPDPSRCPTHDMKEKHFRRAPVLPGRSKDESQKAMRQITPMFPRFCL